MAGYFIGNLLINTLKSVNNQLPPNYLTEEDSNSWLTEEDSNNILTEE